MASSAELAASSAAGVQSGKTVDIKAFIDQQPISAFQ